MIHTGFRRGQMLLASEAAVLRPYPTSLHHRVQRQVGPLENQCICPGRKGDAVSREPARPVHDVDGGEDQWMGEEVVRLPNGDIAKKFRTGKRKHLFRIERNMHLTFIHLAHGGAACC